MSAIAWAALAVFAVAYVLIATEKIHRVAAALGGATAVGASANVVVLGIAERGQADQCVVALLRPGLAPGRS
ncbi:hypothetical protein [Micromonospora sp. CPCC 206061]|uniref:hypothetical protein n=1 Tax=Micromonospora sp. CPCC 206061 TaxID=3122410 RepID=UPI002FF0947F